MDNEYLDLKKKILEFAEKAETENPDLNPKIRERLEKEYFELCNFQRHDSNSRWTVTSFFVMLSFSIAYFSLQILSKGQDFYRLGAYSLIFSACVYWLAFALFKRNKQLTYGIRNYLKSLSLILGFYYQEYIEEQMGKGKRTINILKTTGILYSIVITLISIYYIFRSFGLI